MQALGVSWGERKGRRRAAMAAVASAALLVPGSAAGASGDRSSALQQVIVQAVPGAVAQAEQAVRAAGGKVARELHLVNGFSATLPAGSRLGRADGVLAVTPDRAMHVLAATYAPATDVGAPLAVQTQIGASSYYQNGFYGQGVGVALVDSGVVPEDGLRHNVYFGPDFTPEATDPTLKYLDTYGHGTFMAGLISGRTDAAARPYSDPANYVGVAPESTLVSLKVADNQGNTQESAVVAAVDWATQHMTDMNLNIRVLNLSLGATNTGYLNDPLAAAVERAWSFGITVVSAAGNEGTAGLDLPAVDPYGIAVGALDNQNTASLGDDRVASFSNSGAGGRNPDLVAPGTHIVGLRDVGSYIDNTFGSTGAVTGSLFRGSGTSEAAAITSGAAALVISQHPTLTPDQVKGILSGTARSIVGSTWATAGPGQINLSGAYGAGIPNTTTTAAHAAGFGSFANSLWGGTWSGSVWQSAPHTDVLLSQGKQATASSQESGTFPASAAVDGDAATRWASAFTDNQWLTVDLGASATVGSVTLNWEAAYAKAFQVQTSNDNSSWTTIYSTTAGTGGVQTLNVSGTGRYVRVFGTVRATAYGFSLFELRVNGYWTAQACSTGNAALGRPATASSVENAAYYPASAAVDGSGTSRWSSAATDGQWLQVDLGSQQALCMVSLSWEAAYGTAFQLQTSLDATNWSTVYSTTTGSGGLQNLPVAGNARYLRMYGSARATGYGFSLYELQVHTSTGAAATAVAEGDGGTVSGSRWTGSRWTGVVWTGSRWTGATWASANWANRSWR
ncbi:MAG: hypothetical protein QOJ11_4090 [Frankiales bacterium]|jgi:hypothetical protein|nr:hypothetical protein [Frankiales bacterium]